MEKISLLVGRNLEAVIRMLGPVDKLEMVEDSRVYGSIKASFLNKAVEVVFIDQVADWITVKNVGNNAIEEFIKVLGINLANPLMYNKRIVVRYYNIGGLKRVTFLNDGEHKISSISIKAFTD